VGGRIGFNGAIQLGNPYCADFPSQNLYRGVVLLALAVDRPCNLARAQVTGDVNVRAKPRDRTETDQKRSPRWATNFMDSGECRRSRVLKCLLTMRVRRNGETLFELLIRLDRAVAKAYTEDVFTDEINPPPTPSRLRSDNVFNVDYKAVAAGRLRSPGPRALSPFFESRFARLQYAGDDRFHLAYFRHTGQWWEVMQLLSLEECLDEIRAGGLFTP
jgi:hypothetical protein